MVAPVGKLIDRDLGYKRIKRDFKRASRGPFRVDVGLIEGGAAAAKHPKSNLTVGEVGSLHEFGTENIPERSFLRATFDQEVNRDMGLSIQFMGEFVDGRQNIPKALRLLGDRKRSQIIRRINAGIPPPLDASTVARKGHSTPLIDTGSLVAAIEVEIGK